MSSPTPRVVEISRTTEPMQLYCSLCNSALLNLKPDTGMFKDESGHCFCYWGCCDATRQHPYHPLHLVYRPVKPEENLVPQEGIQGLPQGGGSPG